MTLLAFDEFLHRCRPDLEADMRLRPPSTLDAFEQIAGEVVGSHALSADLARLYTWRDGQERRWPPLFLHARFSFLGLEEARNEARRLARRLDHMPGVLGEGCFPIGVSNLGDLLITERGGHGRVLAFLHDGEPEERVWPISDNLLRFLHDEFRARIETHEAPCMLAEQIIFDRSRLRRVSLQSLRRTDLEAAPKYGHYSSRRERLGRVRPDHPRSGVLGAGPRALQGRGPCPPRRRTPSTPENGVVARGTGRARALGWRPARLGRGHVDSAMTRTVSRNS